MAIDLLVNGKDTESLPWRELHDPGCYVKVLGQNPETGAIAGYFKMDPNCEAAPHDHPSTEFDYVLEGEVEVGGIVYGPGSLFHRDAGLLHGPHRSGEKGVLIFACFSGPSGREKKLGVADVAPEEK